MHQDELIADATKIIVEKANPKRIILFGRRARGDAHKASDLALMSPREGWILFDEISRDGKVVYAA
jgi:predicted nucleotidyltransferase